jgi:hypothetical protein
MDSTVFETAKVCFKETGLYPISFCLPFQKKLPFLEKPKAKKVSFIIPGDASTFVFTDEISYMNEYQISEFARTRKKGGWDCVRHLEIMAASSVPLFKDIQNCPRFTMVHYPKSLFQEINETWENLSPQEYDSLVKKTYQWFSENLTSNEMVNYLLKASGNEPAKNILFIDRALTKKPDCQSAMILGGLKNVFKSNCEVAYPIDCMYKDSPFPKKPHWWKTNFNIYRILSEDHRSPNETKFNQNQIIKNIKEKKYDLIVYGSVTRSLELFELVKKYYPKQQVIGINGEDDLLGGSPGLPPMSKRLKQRIRNFIRRNKYSGPQPDPAIPCLDQWRKLKNQIAPYTTLFMRELVT